MQDFQQGDGGAAETPIGTTGKGAARRARKAASAPEVTEARALFVRDLRAHDRAVPIRAAPRAKIEVGGADVRVASGMTFLRHS